MMTATHPTAEGIGGPERAPAELLDVKQVAALVNASPRTVYRLADAGKMPFGLKLNGMRRWRRAELIAWLDAGCPPVRAAKGVAR